MIDSPTPPKATEVVRGTRRHLLASGGIAVGAMMTNASSASAQPQETLNGLVVPEPPHEKSAGPIQAGAWVHSALPTAS